MARTQTRGTARAEPRDQGQASLAMDAGSVGYSAP